MKMKMSQKYQPASRTMESCPTTLLISTLTTMENP